MEQLRFTLAIIKKQCPQQNTKTENGSHSISPSDFLMGGSSERTFVVCGTFLMFPAKQTESIADNHQHNGTPVNHAPTTAK